MRVHLAGACGEKFSSAVGVTGHPWALISYLDLEGSNFNRKLLGRVERGSMIVDSGLFSFMFGTRQGEIPATFEAYRDFTRRYLDDLDSVGYTGLLVEADTQKLLGLDATMRLREEFESISNRVIYVWHAPETIAGLEVLAKTRSYIALSVPEIRLISGGTFSTGSTTAVWKLLSHINKVCGDDYPRIHLLGCTQCDLMETPLAWSCDSTSWLSGVRYGQTFRYDGGNRLVSDPNNAPASVRWQQRALKRYGDQLPVISGGADQNYVASLIANATAFADYQRWLDAHVEPKKVRAWNW